VTNKTLSGRLIVSHTLITLMEEHCQRAYPNEGCGILLGLASNGQKEVVDVLLTGNAREEGAQHNRYLIPAEDLLRGEMEAEQRGLEVIGYFHSHPDHPAQPSDFDRDHAWPWYSYLIMPVRDGKAGRRRAWQLLDDRSAFVEVPVVLPGD
jgi:proteasome lid subunit RPN8/RPN11